MQTPSTKLKNKIYIKKVVTKLHPGTNRSVFNKNISCKTSFYPGFWKEISFMGWCMLSPMIKLLNHKTH